jgi:hypothetical protein
MLYRLKRPAHQSSRRHFRHGQRAAALRALTAAKLYQQGIGPTLDAVAGMCGSNARYVAAAIQILQSEDLLLLDAVVAGKVPVLQAAAQVRRQASLVAAYRNAEETDRVALARAVGAEVIFDTLVSAIA